MKPSKYSNIQTFSPALSCDWVKKSFPEKAPVWCSVDLRDGNQALVTPMNRAEKLEYFELLKTIGLKQIEAGTPARSDEEYNFIRHLIENSLVPNDITIQVISEMDEGSLRRSISALNGLDRAILHIFGSLSDSILTTVYGKTRDEAKSAAISAAFLLKNLAHEQNCDLTIEYTPEGFTDTDTDYALDVCNAVIEALMPEFSGKIIINIPATVETTLPHVFASQIEYLNKRLHFRESLLLSVHPHNDMGGAIAAAELSLLAGADRIEGTLFGNGERTGNADIMTVALNLLTHGVDPGLCFNNLPEIRETYERLTGLSIFARHPYAGDLVFTALSASHQDAIAKGVSDFYDSEKQGVNKPWRVPYLPIDPADIGRKYESNIIRINSISGKGGVSYILKNNFGFILPEKMKSVVSDAVLEVPGMGHAELTGERIFEIFESRFINSTKIFSVPECHFRQTDGISADVTIRRDGSDFTIYSVGNGRLDATSNAIKQFFGIDYELSIYEEHALSHGSSSAAAAYVGITADGKVHWGVGTDSDIIKASIHALVVAVNAYLSGTPVIDPMEQRMISIMNYIQNHYAEVSMDELSEEFHLTKPYLSKYIRQKTGETFGDIVRNLRMNKACELLRSTNLSVEAIAEKVGYPTVEHFNRLFKRRFKVTPVGYRHGRG